MKASEYYNYVCVSVWNVEYKYHMYMHVCIICMSELCKYE